MVDWGTADEDDPPPASRRKPRDPDIQRPAGLPFMTGPRIIPRSLVAE